jgi:hypothetical protein
VVVERSATANIACVQQDSVQAYALAYFITAVIYDREKFIELASDRRVWESPIKLLFQEYLYPSLIFEGKVEHQAHTGEVEIRIKLAYYAKR